MKIPNLPQNYKVISLLGKGSHGESYLVYDKNADNKKVIKIINNYHLWRKVKRHEDILCKIDSSFIVHIYSFNVYNSIRFIEQEYVHGLTLNDFFSQENLTLNDFINISFSFFNAMHYLTEMGLSHKDIKPSNIIYNQNEGIAKLIDIDYLGIIVSSDKNFIGTVKYASPEQVLENKHSIESDIYSFGLIMCLMTMGSIPFDIDINKTNKELKEKLPLIINNIENINQLILDKIVSLIMSALEFDPKTRITPKKAINEIQQIKNMSVEWNQGDSILYNRLKNDLLVFEADDATDIETSILMMSISAIVPPLPASNPNKFNHDNKLFDFPTAGFQDDRGDGLDETVVLPKQKTVKTTIIDARENKYATKKEDKHRASSEDKLINKNVYRKHLLKEYDNIFFQAKVSFWLWVVSFFICFVLITVSVICIIQKNYIEGVATVVLDGFVVAIQKLFNIREDHYRKLIEQKMAHLETGDYLEYAFDKVEILDNQQDRNKEALQLIKAIRERAKLNK